MAALAARQHGLVTTRQLVTLGFPSSAILRRVRAGRLHLVHRHVYAVGHRGLSFDARCLAAVMAGGAGSALTARAALALWGVLAQPPEPFDVTTVKRSREGAPGIVLHRPRRPPQIASHRGVPVATIPQALLDLAATRPGHELDRAIREAHATGRVNRVWLEMFVEQAAGRPGAPALRRALGLQGNTRSRPERRLLALCRRAGIERPQVNQEVAGLEVDFFWPQHGLVVEADTFATHGTRHAFERDRRRDAILARAGVRVLRFSDLQIDQAQAMVVDTLHAVMG